jgi:hypothetical protein
MFFAAYWPRLKNLMDMKKLFLVLAAAFVSVVAFNASAQYAYPQYAMANQYRPLGDNEAVILTEDDVTALDEAGAIDWSKGDLKLKGTRLGQVQTVTNKKGKEVEKNVKLPKDVQQQVLGNVGGVDFNPLWKKYAAMQNAGMYLLIGGSLFMIGGAAAGGGLLLVGVVIMPIVVALAVVFTGGQADASEVWDSVWEGIEGKAKIGGSIAVAGTAIAITGAVLLAIGHQNLKRMVRYTNAVGKPQAAAFNFGATPSGVGLTFNF